VWNASKQNEPASQTHRPVPRHPPPLYDTAATGHTHRQGVKIFTPWNSVGGGTNKAEQVAQHTHEQVGGCMLREEAPRLLLSFPALLLPASRSRPPMISIVRTRNTSPTHGSPVNCGILHSGCTTWPGTTTALEKMVVPMGSARCSFSAARGPLPVTCCWVVVGRRRGRGTRRGRGIRHEAGASIVWGGWVAAVEVVVDAAACCRPHQKVPTDTFFD
jgi:hypothetical protein